jgi:hypothetical protein
VHVVVGAPDGYGAHDHDVHHVEGGAH